MATVTLEPQDLTPAQAARVLTLLNAAVSAQALAAAIEIPGELDIGVRLAQRLLDARAQLGGRFTQLAQVRAVRLIGPERFTEICAAALGLDPRRWITQLGDFTDRQAALEAQLLRLSGLAEGAQAQREGAHVDLTAKPQPLWLGQALDIRLICTDLTGRPLPGRRVTVTTSTGTLEVAFGYAVQRAAGVAVRTGADGSARLTLRLTPPDGLTAEQQAVLEGALDTLDPQAESAVDLAPALAALAEVYTRERAGTLRAALDLYACQYRAVFLDRLNPGGAGVAFALESSVLRADLHGAGGAASVAHAVLVAHHRNWVGAWLDALGEYVAGRAALDAAFGGATQRGATGQRLVNDLVAEAQVYIAGLPGIAAQWAAQRRVNTAMQRYLARDTATLDLPTRQSLFAQLTDAAQQITPESRGTLAAVAQVKAELGTRIEQVGGISGALADEMRGLRTEVVARAADVSRTAATVAQQAAQVQTDRAAVTADRQRVETRSAEFDTRLATFNTRYDDFNTRYQGFTVDYGSFQTDFTRFSTDYGQFRTDAGALNTRVTAVEGGISRLDSQSAVLDQRVTTIDSRTTTQGQQLATLNTQTATLNQRVSTLDTQATTLNQRVSTLDTQHTVLAQDVGALRVRTPRGPG